jgi:hypothetical protein
MELSKQGIPYSLTEAEAAVKAHGHLMDEYHKSLMEWLISEVRAGVRMVLNRPTVNYCKVIAAEPIRQGDYLAVWPEPPGFVLRAKPWGQSPFVWMSAAVALSDAKPGDVIDAYERHSDPVRQASIAKILKKYLVREEGVMPAKSEKQRRFMAADLNRAQKGQKTQTGMSEAQLKDFTRKGGKKK